MNFAELSAPFPPDAIHWRAQTVTKDGDKALALAYLDARDVQDRLDAVCGPANWRDSYVETPKGRTICTLEIRVDGEWIGKSDGAGDTDVEGEKGSISDALKRAAVKWGIGRYLYDLGNVWAPCESYEIDDRGKKRMKWKKWKPEADRAFAAALNRLTGGAPAPTSDPVGEKPQAAAGAELVNDGHLQSIRAAARQAKFSEATICRNMKISRLEDLPADQYQFVIDNLNIAIANSEQKRAA